MPGDIEKYEFFLGALHGQNARGPGSPLFAFQLQRNVVAVRSDQADRQRDVERQLFFLTRRRRAGLLHRQDVTPGGPIPVPAHLQHWRAGLVVPAPELGKVHVRGVLHGLDEFLGSHRLAVVTLEIQIHALAKVRRPDQRVDHAHHFRTLLVHGGGVEVADLHI